MTGLSRFVRGNVVQVLLACGTGSCSVAVASFLNGRTGREVDIQLPLGTLHIEYREEDGNVYMTGPAAVSFTGTWPDET